MDRMDGEGALSFLYENYPLWVGKPLIFVSHDFAFLSGEGCDVRANRAILQRSLDKTVQI